MWKLFLDDERFPPDASFIIFRNAITAFEYIKMHGMPEYMSLDHDLGNNVPTGYDFCNMIVEYMLDNDLKFPNGFDFYVHSMNPIGKQNIKFKLKNAIAAIGVSNEKR